MREAGFGSLGRFYCVGVLQRLRLLVFGNRVQALILGHYCGWYRQLMGTGESTIGGRSRRVDVVVRPLGWVGTYRKSRTTELWFRGKHSVHLLGNEPIEDKQ